VCLNKEPINTHNKILRLVSSVESALLVLALVIEQLKISSRYTITKEILNSLLSSASTLIFWLSWQQWKVEIISYKKLAYFKVLPPVFPLQLSGLLLKLCGTLL
jgi:hypothetical protein